MKRYHPIHGTLPMSIRCFILLLLLGLTTPSLAAEPTAEQLAFFEKRVRPVLVEYCYKCHSTEAKKLKASLFLDSRAGMIKGGDTGPSFNADKPQDSLLLKAISYTDVDLEMPPKGKLPAEHIQALTQWVKMGAPWPNDGNNTAGKVKEFDLKQRQSDHWSWKPVTKRQPPAVKQTSWPRDSIDQFILAKLESKQLTPAGEASRRQWIRRASFDLIGLPPTPDEVNAFLADKSAKAYETVADRLLASPHFGERWARHWMDLARYAESYGHEFDYALPHAHQYRDYLIRAFNSDLPYNRFVMEQIAGDELEPRLHPTEGYNESIIATGFWWLGEAIHAPVDVRGDEAGRIDNQIDVFAKSFLGLTIACARCHDHKFDAITTKDYYAMAGFLQSSRRNQALLDPNQRIDKSVSQIKALRAKGDAVLASRMAKPQAAGALKIDQYLLAAAEALRAPRVKPKRKKTGLVISDDVIDQIAGDAKLDAKQLRRWVDALLDDASKSPTHPLYAWHQLASEAKHASEKQFVAARQRVAADLQNKLKQVNDASAASPLIGDFNGGDLDGWFTTGWAFGEAPVQPGEWNGESGESSNGLCLETGVVNGQVNGEKLQGTLRSPTFTIDHNQVSIRMKGQGVTVRLIIDGFFMEPYNGLLFRGTRVQKVNTKDQYQWINLGGDIQRYHGHTAWIEILDEGNGYAIVDEVRTTNGPLPGDRPSEVSVAVTSDAKVNSIESLAKTYEQRIANVVKQWHTNRKAMTQSDAELANWLISYGVLAGNHDATDAADATFEANAKALADLKNSVASPTPVLAMTSGSGENEHVFIRGKHTNLGDEVPRRFLEAIDSAPITPKDRSGRLELAKKVVDPSNPYASRVIVNRLWHHLFGRGIVPSTDDFGFLGQRPTHPELLDHLAVEFVADGWSIKRMLKRMVLTATYRMDSQHESKAMTTRVAEVDPNNTLLHKARIRRLQAEAIRDSVLAISGRLNRKMYGPSVNVHLTAFMEGRGRPAGGPLDGDGRRSLYITIRRNFLAPMMLAFDYPNPFNAVGRRTVSNVPAQALIMMNDPFIVQQAQLWAKRLAAAEPDKAKRIALMYEQGLTRPPSDSELNNASAFLVSQAKVLNTNANDERVWADLCHVMMNLKEFIYLP